jgi:hypothetical protein
LRKVGTRRHAKEPGRERTHAPSCALTVRMESRFSVWQEIRHPDRSDARRMSKRDTTADLSPAALPRGRCVENRQIRRMNRRTKRIMKGRCFDPLTKLNPRELAAAASEIEPRRKD